MHFTKVNAARPLGPGRRRSGPRCFTTTRLPGSVIERCDREVAVAVIDNGPSYFEVIHEPFMRRAIDWGDPSTAPSIVD